MLSPKSFLRTVVLGSTIACCVPLVERASAGTFANIMVSPRHDCHNFMWTFVGISDDSCVGVQTIKTNKLRNCK